MMALVYLIEYDLSSSGDSSFAGSTRLSQSLNLRKSLQLPTSTTVAVGGAIFFPVTGTQLHLRYRPGDDSSPAVAESKYSPGPIEEDELNIELPLLFGALCKTLTPAAAFV